MELRASSIWMDRSSLQPVYGLHYNEQLCGEYWPRRRAKPKGNGAIDQVRIYNRGLTVTELNDTSRQLDSNTVLWMDFDESVIDKSQNQLIGSLHGNIVQGVNGAVTSVQESIDLVT